MTTLPITSYVHNSLPSVPSPSIIESGMYAVAKLVAYVVTPLLLIADLVYMVVKKVGEIFPSPLQSFVGPIEFYDFYDDSHCPNREGVTLSDIWAWDDAKLESVHSYIQWLFPTFTQSKANTNIPSFNQNTADLFKRDPRLQQKVISSLRLMLRFYGLMLDEKTLTISRAPNFASRIQVWLTSGNHNFLRITRIIESLKIMGLEQYARAFHAIMVNVARNEGQGIISDGTIGIWTMKLN